MVGILVATHGNLSDGFLSALSVLLGSTDSIATLSLQPGTDPIQFRDEIKHAIEALDSGSGVLVFLDLFGGTPSNAAMQLVATHHIECIAGVNLPMLIECASQQDSMDLQQLADLAIKTAETSYVDLRRIFENQMSVEDTDEDF